LTSFAFVSAFASVRGTRSPDALARFAFAIAFAANARKLGARPTGDRAGEGKPRARIGEYGPGEGGTNGENPSADAGLNPGLYASKPAPDTAAGGVIRSGSEAVSDAILKDDAAV
jgi:hypothetical protein